jgi:hypothetical protein
MSNNRLIDADCLLFCLLFKVTVEKRSAVDGSLVWTRAEVAVVQYGWFHTSLSDDGSLLYLWPGTQGAWIAALTTD